MASAIELDELSHPAAEMLLIMTSGYAAAAELNAHCFPAMIAGYCDMIRIPSGPSVLLLSLPRAEETSRKRLASVSASPMR